MRKTLAFLVVLCCALVSASALAQDVQTKGSIGGTVVDQNGATIPAAAVTITGAEGERTATTDGSGIFVVENLTPGTYVVKVSSAGFKTTSVSNVQVFVGKQAALKIRLAPGEITAVVDVTAAATIDQA